MKKAELCSRYISAKMEIKILKEELEELEKSLRIDIEADFRKNGSATITYGNYTVSLNEQIRNVADTEALKRDGMYEKYSRPSVAEYFKVVKK
jgi:hypothetical protein